MRVSIIEISGGNWKRLGNLYHSPHNQIRRAVGNFEVVYCGGVEGGTVRDRDGKCWDWWPTEEVIHGTTFRKVRVVEAR